MISFLETNNPITIVNIFPYVYTKYMTVEPSSSFCASSKLVSDTESFLYPVVPRSWPRRWRFRIRDFVL